MNKWEEYNKQYILIEKEKVSNGDTIVLFDLGSQYVVWNYYPEKDLFLNGDYFRAGLYDDIDEDLDEAFTAFEKRVELYNE